MYAYVNGLRSLVQPISMWKSFEELEQECASEFSVYVFLSTFHLTLESMGLNLAYTCRCLLKITKTNRRKHFTFPLRK